MGGADKGLRAIQVGDELVQELFAVTHRLPATLDALSVILLPVSEEVTIHPLGYVQE
jgi:hypothetical protein